jgi:hypothetical protein
LQWKAGNISREYLWTQSMLQADLGATAWESRN